MQSNELVTNSESEHDQDALRRGPGIQMFFAGYDFEFVDTPHAF